MDKKLLALVVAAIIVLSGILLSTPDSPPLYRYFIAIFGEFAVLLIAVFIGFDNARAFTLKSIMGKSLAFISAGMLVWGFGNLAWLYYNVVAQIEIPYPSLADVGYVGMIPLAAFGLFLLLKSIKIQFDKATILKITIIPLAAFLVTYSLFIGSKVAEDVDPVVKILNVAYPVGDMIFLSFALVILSLVRDGRMFRPVSILSLGFIVEAAADFAFSWTTTAGTYYVASFTDVLFTLAFFVIGVGMHYMNELGK